jgi:hypothetical protein
MLLSEEDDSVDGGEAAGGEANEDRRCGRDGAETAGFSLRP